MTRVRSVAPQRILFAASEIFPLAKTGGLADVCASLPAALAGLGAEVQLVMPGYEQALDLADRPHVTATLDNVLGFENVRIITARTPDTALPINLIDIPELYRNGGGIYQNADGSDRDDNAIRFGVFGQAAAQIAAGRGGSTWHPNIVHCNDWQTGLVPLMLRELCGPEVPATVFTAHNMMFQGLFPWEGRTAFRLPTNDGIEAGLGLHGQLSFLKAGLYFSDSLTTVSPTYAREIQTPDYGYGLEGLVQARAGHLTGILNGINSVFWDPSGNTRLAANYSAQDLSGKRYCKNALQRELGLVEDENAPLIIFVGRLTWQKMADILRDCLPAILAREPDRQFALLGQGERGLEDGFRSIAAAFPGRVSVQIGYCEDRAHRIHAGGDILLHGSQFEPCGLTQLYAMRFGTIPIVRPVGGLADTVVHASEQALVDGTATGVWFEEPSAEAMISAVDHAIWLYRQPLTWRRLQRVAMGVDSSWDRSARQYLTLYSGLWAQRLGAAAGQDADIDAVREIA